jgi:3-oxoacyl-[acyl-carrier-protein] synthase-3
MSAVETGATMGISPEESQKIATGTGVHSRHVADPHICTSDMCSAAASNLLEATGWDAASIDALVFVSQTPDYHLPATACIIQERLGLAKSCAAFDLNLGCSGYVYGLWVVSRLMSASGIKRALLLAGETASWTAAPTDRAVSFLFGDAGTATAIEFDADAAPMSFSLGTDGTGHRNIMIPGGGYRNRTSAETLVRSAGEDGVLRNEHESRMNGPEVFTFTLREVPALIKGALATAGKSIDEIDSFVPHQANLFMLQHLAKKMKIPQEKVALGLAEYGNTSSASIPLTICSTLRDRVAAGRNTLMLAGFGVGWSWGAAVITCDSLIVPPIAEVA